MSKHPWECVFICNSVYKSQRLDAVNSSGRAPHEFESCSMSAHKSSGKQSHPVILLRVTLLSLKTNQIHLCSHTCRSFTFLSSHRMFLLSHLYGFLSPLLCLLRSPGVFQPAAVQHRRRLLPCHVHLQQQHCGLQRERSHRYPSQPARQHG